MLFNDFTESLEKRLAIYEAVPANVDAAALCREILREAKQVQPEDDRWVSQNEAEAITGYSGAHLRRMRRQGKVETKGEGGSTLYLLKSLPRKAGKVATDDETLQLFPESDEQAVRESVGVP